MQTSNRVRTVKQKTKTFTGFVVTHVYFERVNNEACLVAGRVELEKWNVIATAPTAHDVPKEGFNAKALASSFIG